MKNVKIYQTDNRDYAFMNWEWSEKYFDMNDYKCVLDINMEFDDLEEIYFKGNNGELKKHNYYMRSISVSDVIEVEGKRYFVDSFGFKEIEE